MITTFSPSLVKAESKAENLLLLLLLLIIKIIIEFAKLSTLLSG